METRTVIGKSRAGERQLDNMTAGDPWAEAPFYAAGPGSENITGLQAGDQLCAVFHGMRLANKGQGAAKERPYAVFKTEEGELFRLFTPGQLEYNLRQLDVGTYVEITYRGKEHVEKLGQEVHQFDIAADRGARH